MESIESMLTSFLKQLKLSNYKDAVRNRVDIAALISQSFPEQLKQAKLMAPNYADEARKFDINSVMEIFRNEHQDVYYYFKTDRTAMQWLEITVQNVKKLLY